MLIIKFPHVISKENSILKPYYVHILHKKAQETFENKWYVVETHICTLELMVKNVLNSI